MAHSKEPTLYDDLFYPGHVYERTHPNRLATMAALFGMEPVPVRRCRVLELGCGAGGNLMPMAFQYPQSEFIGVDLSGATIERGMRNVEALGLTNISLLHCDIMDVDAAFGRFDYIIAHGVYSWVPPAVRVRMMEIFKSNLSPNGVCYVSYNSHPYSHLRNVARDMMLYHTRNITDMQQKIGQARAILKFVAEGSKEASVHGSVMRQQLERVMKMKDEVLFHDDLNAGAEAFLLHRVVEEAAGHGLQYLSDAEFTLYDLARYSPQVRATLEEIPEREFVARDQFTDFLNGHGFRRTLLCHDNVALQRTIPPDFITRFHLWCSAEAADADGCLTDTSPIMFKGLEGATLTFDRPIIKAAFTYFQSCWPRAVLFTEVLGGARALLARKADDENLAEDTAILTQAFYAVAHSGELSFRIWPQFEAAAIGDRPKVSRLARKQAENGTLVTNLLHESVRLADDKTRHFVQLLDGTRTLDEIIAAMSQAFPDLHASAAGAEAGSLEAAPAIHEAVKAQLKVVHKLGLLAG